MCTSIKFNAENNIILAQNYDFYYGHGLIIKNIRGLSKVALSEDLTRDNFYSEENSGAKWTSKYGSITFNQFARELPTCGINETGLAITSMWHDSEEKNPPEGKNQITELQWIQMQLDLYSTVEEVVNNLQTVSYGVQVAPMHYFLCDKTGNSVIIESENNKLRAHKSDNVYACSNTGIEESLEYIEKNKESDADSINVKDSALKRFQKAFLLSREIDDNDTNDEKINPELLFSVLDKVSLKADFGDLFKWLAKQIPPSQTFWQIAFNISDMSILFKTKSNRKKREISIDNFDFSEKSKVEVFDVEEGEGNISNSFNDYTLSANKRIVKKSFAPIKKQFPIKEQKELIEYPELFRINA